MSRTSDSGSRSSDRYNVTDSSTGQFWQDQATAAWSEEIRGGAAENYSCSLASSDRGQLIVMKTNKKMR